MEPIVYMNETQVRQELTAGMANFGVTGALKCHALGEYEQPLKPYLYPLGRDNVDDGGRFITMPARLGDPFNCAGFKFIAGFPGNHKRGLPRASGIIGLNCVKTGVPLALMECSLVSATRTAAVAAVSILHLGPQKAEVISILGTGPVAESCVSVLCDLFMHPAEFRVFDLDKARSVEFAKRMERPDRPPVRVYQDAKECVVGADVVITATTAKESYLRLDWLSQAKLIVALSFEDCEPSVMLSSDIVVDSYDDCCREEKPIHRLAKQGLLSRDAIYGEIGQIVAGQIPGRTNDSQRFYFNPMGMAIEDIAVAWLVYKAAKHKGNCTFLPR